MNHQIGNKILFQLTNKQSKVVQAALIIKSFDILSWFHKDCNIQIEDQNKIQIYEENKKKKCELPFQLKSFGQEFTKDLKEELQKNLNSQLQRKHKQYLQKAQNQQILINKILQKINTQLQLQNTPEALKYKKIQKREYLKYRRFNINNKSSNIQNDQVPKQIKQNDYKKGQFFLIQNLKICKKQQRLNQTDWALIKYTLIDGSSINKDFYNFEVQITKKDQKMLEIQIRHLDQFLRKYFRSMPIASDIDEYMRKNLIIQTATLKSNQFEYPYTEPKQKRSKQVNVSTQNSQNVGNKHYALAFQGGGAKGLAYVGVYKALLQTGIPIKSIIGSSAGGIFALAVSTGISPSQLQKICYSMNQIPKHDRIVIKKSAERDRRQKQVFDAIKLLLHQHGILPNNMFDYVKSQLKPDLVEGLRELLESFSGTFGQIIEPLQKDQHFNYYGLLLQGAAMKGQAIQSIASECLGKYMFKEYIKGNRKLKNVFTSSKHQLVTKALQKHRKNYQNLKQLTLKFFLDQISPQMMNGEHKKNLIIVMINKILLYLSQLETQQENNQITDSCKLRSFDFSKICKLFKLKARPRIVGSLDQQLVYDILNIQQRQIYIWRQQKKNIQDKTTKAATSQPQLSTSSMNFPPVSNQSLAQIDVSSNSNTQKVNLSMNRQQQSSSIQMINIEKLFKLFTQENNKLIFNAYTTRQILSTQIKKEIQQIKYQIQEMFDFFTEEQRDYFKIKKLVQILTQILNFGQRLGFVESSNKAQELKIILQNLQKQKIKYSIVTLKDFQSYFDRPFILDPSLFQVVQNPSLFSTLSQDKQITLGAFFQTISRLLGDNTQQINHWMEIADIVCETVQYFTSEKKQQSFINQMNYKEPEKTKWQRIKSLFSWNAAQLRGLPQLTNIKVEIITKKNKDYQCLKNIMKTITLAQYYQLNQVQLTSTSVDLDHDTMRFFNHKTTPDLPVCKSVQMTGSFPVGFLAQKWKSEWGNYYVHYDGLRRQIDLTGNQFTDGGMLANFPIKYLDNPIMRSKYFSHRTNESKFLGFGLDQISSDKYYQSPQQMQHHLKQSHQNSIAFQKFKNILENQFGMLQQAKLYFKYLGSNSPSQVVVDKNFKDKIEENIRKIPLLNFLIKLIKAYPNADRYLNLECFSQNIIYENLQALQHLYSTQNDQNIRDQIKTFVTEINKGQRPSINETQFPRQNQNLQFQFRPQLRIILGLSQIQFQRQQLGQQLRQQYKRRRQNIDKIFFDKTIQNLQQNCISNQEKFIKQRFRGLTAYFNFPTNLDAVEQHKRQLQRKKKSHNKLEGGQKNVIQISNEMDNYISSYSSKLRITIMQAMMQKMKELPNAIEKINQYTIEYLFRYARYATKQIQNDCNNILQKLTSLAQCKFRKMFEQKQFNQIQKLACFKNFKDKYYENVVGKKQGSQQNIYDQSVKNLKSLNKKELQQFVDVKGQHITKDIKTFTLFIFSRVAQNQVQERFKQIYEINPNEVLISRVQIFSAVKLLIHWSTIFGQPIMTQEYIIKNYFEWQLAEQIFAQMKTNTAKIFKDLMKQFGNEIKNPNNQRYGIIQQIGRLQNLQSKDYQLAVCKYIMGNYKDKILEQNNDSLISTLVQRWSNKHYDQYLVNRNLQVINPFEMIRVCDLIKNLMNSKRDNQIKKKINVRNVLQDNSTLFFYQIHKDYFREFGRSKQIQNKKKAKQILDIFYENCTLKISKYFSDSILNQIDAVKKASQQDIIKTIIDNEQHILRHKIKQCNLKLEQLILDECKSEDSLLRDNGILMKYHCYMFTFKRIKLQIFTQQLQNRLNKERVIKIQQLQQINRNQLKLKKEQRQKKEKKCLHQIKLAIDKVYKFRDCRQDYLFFNTLINQICCRLSKQLVSNPFNNLKNMIKLWRDKIKRFRNDKVSKKEFLQFKKSMIETCRRYYRLINKMCSDKYKSTSQFRQFEIQIGNLQKFQIVIFNQQYIDIQVQIVGLDDILKELQVFFQLSLNQQYSKMLFFNVNTKALEKNIHTADRLLQKMNSQIEKKLMQFIKNKDQQIFISDIQQLFLVSGYFFQELSNLQEQIFNVDKQFFSKLKNRIFSIPLICIDRKQLQIQKKFQISNRIFSILDNQLQKVPSKKLDNYILYRLHLVMEGVGKSNLYYPSYFKMIEQNLGKFASWKNEEIVRKQIIRTQQNVRNKQCQLNQKTQNLKIHIQISAITCSNFHSVFGFLYAAGLSDEQIRKQMNTIQNIAEVLETNIDQNFDQYKWTSCSQMQMKQCFNQVWNDQYNVFKDLQKAYLSQVNILKNIQSAKQMYITDKKKIMSYCENSFQDLIDLVNKKIDKKTYQKRKVQICKSLGINYICQYQKIHPYETINSESTQYFQSMIKSMFIQYQSLIQYIITSNELILKNFFITQGSKTYLWKGIVIKKLFTTYKLKKYICDHLKKFKMNTNITLGEFYIQANKKILLTFTTIDNAEKKLQFMNKNSLPNMPVWAAILASSSLNYLFRQFEARKQWTREQYIGSSLFSKVVRDFFQKQSKIKNITNYSSGNIISTLPLQLLTNITVRKQIFTLEEKNENDDRKIQKQTPRYIYLALAFSTLPIKPQNYRTNLKRNYLEGAYKKVYPLIQNKIPILNKYLSLSQIISKKWNNVCTTSNHQNNTYNIQQNTYVTQKLLKLISYGTTGKSLNLFVQSNDNFIMSLYKEKVIKCPIKIGTLDFHQITKKKDYRKLDFPSQKTLQTIQRSYYITKNFINDKNDNLQVNDRSVKKQVFIRVQIFNQEKRTIQSKKQNRKCKLSFLSQSEWNKNPQKQFIVEYSLWEDNYSSQSFVKVQNSQIVWNTIKNHSIYLKFYYPFTEGENNNKSKKFIVENRLYLSIQNLLKEFPQNYNYLNKTGFVSFDYVFDYSQILQSGKHYALKMNKVLIQKQPLQYNVNSSIIKRSWILVKQAFVATYQKCKMPEFSYQFTKFNLKNKNSQEWIAKIDAYSQPDYINKDKEVALACINCKKHLTLKNNGFSSKKCQLCSQVYGKLECKNQNTKQQTFCQNSSFCLNCAHQYIIKRRQGQLFCLLCSTKRILRTEENQHQVRNMSEFKTNILGDSDQKQCCFCYQPYPKNRLYCCSKCNIRICEKCVNNLC